MVDEQTLYLSIGELAERIRSRQLSPVELAEAYLERSARIGPQLNAYATITRDLALHQARTAEREIASGLYRGPLHGIPYAPKDLVAVKGYPTTWGAPPFANQRFDYDATIIEKLNQAGAVMLGKAAMIELAGGLGYTNGSASLTGPAKGLLESGVLDLRIVQRIGRSGGGRAGGVFHRVRYARIHYLSHFLVRDIRHAAEFWTREPLWRDGHCLVHGQVGSYGAQGGRLRLDCRCYRRPRS